MEDVNRWPLRLLASESCKSSNILISSANAILSGNDPVLLEEELVADFKTNVVGNVNLINLFMPLILKGQQKKVLFITSGHGSVELVNEVGIDIAGPYAIGKAAGNIAIAKLNAEYAKDGVLLMSISPGVVSTGNIDFSQGGCDPVQFILF
jgi:NAD(P)-dependent dehydrogenase (short-subunit alcohol dehydrogenase family)